MTVPPLSRGRPFTADGLFDWPVWRAMPAWKLDEALCLLYSSKDPATRVFMPAILRSNHRSIAKSVELHVGKEVRDLFLRKIAGGEITDPAPPAEWLRLAASIRNTPIPPELLPAQRSGASGLPAPERVDTVRQPRRDSKIKAIKAALMHQWPDGRYPPGRKAMAARLEAHCRQGSGWCAQRTLTRAIGELRREIRG